MKFHHVIAATAIAIAGSAQALSPAVIDAARSAGQLKEVRLGGSSALRLFIGSTIQQLCNNDLDVFFDLASGSNHRAYSCTLKAQVGRWAPGTPVVVYKRDAGDSLSGINSVAKQRPVAHLVVNSSAGSCSRTANPTPVQDILLSSYTCAATANAVTDAGISDVEPKLMNSSPNVATGSGAAPALTVAELSKLNWQPLVQGIFGVAVNKKLYRALQEAQGIVGPGGALREVPADQSTWTAADVASIPSLPTVFVRTALTGFILGGAGNNTGTSPPRRGWNRLVPTSVDANVMTKTINICRQVEGSGTHAVANLMFTGAPCLGYGSFAQVNVNNPFDADGSPMAATSGTIGVSTSGVALREEISISGVESCIGDTVQNAAGGSDSIAYGFAILSRENNPLSNGVDKGYRFVKLNGAAPTRNEAKTGNYEFVFEAGMQWNIDRVVPGSDLEAFLLAIRVSAGNPAELAKIHVNAQQGVMSPYRFYSGSYVDQVGDIAVFGSSVSRLSGNSCTSLRIIK